MIRKKILILGSQGQLGKELTYLFSSQKQEYIALDREQLDLTDLEKVHLTIKQIRPDIIVNCAAYTAVDRAEKEIDLAIAVNQHLPETVAKVAQQINSYLIHISTDYVFDGSNNIPYTEKDPVNPISVYGTSKLAGEMAIAEHCNRYVIIRTAWVYGRYGKGNFVKTMIRLGQEKEELQVVSDQIGSPTWTYDLAQAIANIIDQLSEKIVGIYHYTNSGVCSWYDLAVNTLVEIQKLGLSITVKNIIPITTSEYPTPAKRPHYSVLSCQKITKLLGSPPPHWQASLKLMLQDYIKDLN